MDWGGFLEPSRILLGVRKGKYRLFLMLGDGVGLDFGLQEKEDWFVARETSSMY